MKLLCFFNLLVLLFVFNYEGIAFGGQMAERKQRLIQHKEKGSIRSTLFSFGVITSLISDHFYKGYVREKGKEGFTPSTRIEVCESNFFVSPISHVYLRLDKLTLLGIANEVYEDESLEKNSLCLSVMVPPHFDEGDAIKKLNCLFNLYDDFMDNNYHYYTHNCGSFTQNILQIVGIDFPIYANLGVGTKIFKKNPEGYENFVKEAKVSCKIEN